MMAAYKHIIELAGVVRTYRVGSESVEVLKGVDFQLAAGEWCAIFGASGSGKTTLLNLIGALERPDAGTIRVAGENISGFRRREAAKFRASRIGFVFQAYHLLPELTVLENVSLAARLAGVPVSAARERAASLLEAVGLSHRLRHRPTELSGGEQQRAAIARALINDPELLLADEPTGNLDAKTGAGILELFQELRAARPERSIVMITHNRELAGMATRVAELIDGKISG